MPKVEEFDTFYDSTSRYVTHLTYAESGDRTVTEEAVAEAYEKAWQSWAKQRSRDPLGFVRGEAFRHARLSRGTRPWRRRHEDDSDLDLIEALQGLNNRTRRLIILQTLGELDISAAARDLAMTDAEAVAETQQAVTELEQALGQSIGQVESRLLGLSEISERIPLPTPARIRGKARRRRRRHTVVAVAAATAAVVGAGLAVAPTAPMSPAQAQERNRVGETPVEAARPGDAVTTRSLLNATEISRVSPNRDWTTLTTTADEAAPDEDELAAAASADADAAAGEPLTVCAARRFATNNPRKTYVRDFEVYGRPEQAVHVLEVARDADGAKAAYKRRLQWYADCAVPGVQMSSETATIAGAASPVTILRLRDLSSPVRTITIGMMQTGVVNTMLVHETDGAAGPSTAALGSTMVDGMRLACASSGGPCTTTAKVVAAPLPRTSTDPGFLAAVDLPPVGSQTSPWAGTKPKAPNDNPAATMCDQANFLAPGVTKARGRIYVVPNDKAIPKQFGIGQSIATFRSPQQAQAFVQRLQKRIRKCEDRNQAANVVDGKPVRGSGYAGRSWRMTFETGPKSTVSYRLALVCRGATVTEVRQSGNKRADLTATEFLRVADRSGQRLAYWR
ncbi:sensor domain-containing protein [Mumia qirimensis]|uniref:sensor domain-containing protein n=1 Tax=Mumia qirimensis TaxID=3234852 RepID=UPI00351D7C08